MLHTMDESFIVGGTVLLTVVIIVFSLVATIVPIVLVFKWLGKMRMQNQQVLMTGIAAQARIVSVGHTGMTINDAPQLNLVLEVHPPPAPGYRGAAAPFMANAQVLVPIYAMPRIQPGATIPVKFDPMNPTAIAVDFRAMGFM